MIYYIILNWTEVGHIFLFFRFFSKNSIFSPQSEYFLHCGRSLILIKKGAGVLLLLGKVKFDYFTLESLESVLSSVVRFGSIATFLLDSNPTSVS